MLKLNSEYDVLNVEGEKVKQLDWEMRDFLKFVRDVEDSENPTDLGDRIADNFEALALLCKSRAEKLTVNKSKPPIIQLDKSSQSMGRTTSYASEIIDDELEQFQADAAIAEVERQAALAKAKAKEDAEVAKAEAEILKNQALIQAKRLKQAMESGSHRSGLSSFQLVVRDLVLEKQGANLYFRPS